MFFPSVQKIQRGVTGKNYTTKKQTLKLKKGPFQQETSLLFSGDIWVLREVFFLLTFSPRIGEGKSKPLKAGLARRANWPIRSQAHCHGHRKWPLGKIGFVGLPTPKSCFHEEKPVLLPRNNTCVFFTVNISCQFYVESQVVGFGYGECGVWLWCFWS